jgi:hypothetical protein
MFELSLDCAGALVLMSTVGRLGRAGGRTEAFLSYIASTSSSSQGQIAAHAAVRWAQRFLLLTPSLMKRGSTTMFTLAGRPLPGIGKSSSS